MKTFLKLILMFMGLTLHFSCDLFEPVDFDQTPGIVTITEPKALFLGSSGTGSRSDDEDMNTLFEIRSDQSIHEVKILNKDNSEINTHVHAIQKIDDRYVYLYISTHHDNDDRGYATVIDLIDKTIYILGSQLAGEIFSREGMFYAAIYDSINGTHGCIIKRIDMSNHTSVSLNNLEYFAIGGFSNTHFHNPGSNNMNLYLQFLMTDSNDLIVKGRTNTETTDSYYLLDGDRVNPPVKLSGTVYDEIADHIENSLFFFYDDDKAANIVSLNDTDGTVSYRKYTIHNVSVELLQEDTYDINSLGDIFNFSLVSDSSEREHNFIFENGILRVFTDETGSVSITIQEKEILPPSIKDLMIQQPANPVLNINRIPDSIYLKTSMGYIYLLDQNNTTVKRMDPLLDDTYTTLITRPSIIDWEVIAGSVYISEFTNATDVATYRLTETNELEPFSESTIEITSLVEF